MDIYYDIYTHPLFRRLSDSLLREIVLLMEEYVCDEGAVLYYSKDRSGDLFLFLEGEFCASTSDGREKSFYFPGDYTDPRTLLKPDIHDDTLVCRRGGRYLKMKREAFIALSNKLKRADYCRILKDFGLDADSETSSPHQKKEKLNFRWRKSGFFLFQQMQYPIYILFFQFLLWRSTLTFPYDSLFYKASTIIILFYALVRLCLWLMEYYILDDSNLFHIKFSFSPPGMGKTVLPLDQIRGVKVEKSRLRNRFFNVGSLHIQTSSGTVLILMDLDSPIEAEKRISSRIKQSGADRQGRDKQEIRQRMEEYFDVEKDIRQEGSVPESLTLPDDIVFRKSPAYLFGSIWWQILSAGGLIYISWLFRHSGGTYLLLSIIPIAGIMLWRIQDWRNDLYKVSGGKIIDINKKPFGKSETSNLADIGFITNVRAEKKGFFRYLFNYGDVIIETAGGTMCFETVADPSGVQSALLRQREQWKQSEEKKQRDRQFQDFLVYSEVYRQAEEQKRLNRLTPLHAGHTQQGVLEQ